MRENKAAFRGGFFAARKDRGTLQEIAWVLDLLTSGVVHILKANGPEDTTLFVAVFGFVDRWMDRRTPKAKQPKRSRD
ncbi:hypothetical protein [Sphingomonas sp. LHG3406-1]|uniref:hypothetical protein n=1 Tax=Sphingomonas sp. LHG3406-1 TaxID=2804617 RepID=UPI00260C343A|nr:hypothetical protein [Sphingomonas sp. LHG3406-1]